MGYGPTFCVAALGYWLLILLLFNGLDSSLWVLISSAVVTTKSTWATVFSVFVSMHLYRLFSHRLRRFPGPFGAKLTSWWASSLHGLRWHFYKGLRALHRHYGDLVRVAPDELSIIDPAPYIAQTPDALRGPSTLLRNPSKTSS